MAPQTESEVIAEQAIARAQKRAATFERLGGPLLVTDLEMAQLLGVSVDWLRADRRKDRYIPYCRIGGHVRYSPARVRLALEQFEEGGPQAFTSRR